MCLCLSVVLEYSFKFTVFIYHWYLLLVPARRVQAWFLVSVSLCESGQKVYCGSFWIQNGTHGGTEKRDEEKLEEAGTQGGSNSTHANAADAVFLRRGATPAEDETVLAASVPYPRAAAYLGGVPKGGLLILDLEANRLPVYPYTDFFYGHDFLVRMCVWSVLGGGGVMIVGWRVVSGVGVGVCVWVCACDV